MLGGTETGQQQYRDPRVPGLVDGGRDEVELVDPGEPVVEAGAAQPVAVRHLDDLDVAAVKGVHDRAYLFLGELVGERVRPVPQGRVGQPDAGHAGTPVARSSATWAAADVMMSRLPA